MRNATELLTQYAEYHRDRRNIATHFVGVPMIVFGVATLLARPGFMMGDAFVSAAAIAAVLSVAWYLTRGEWLVGAAVSAWVAGLVVLAHGVADGSVARWLAWGLGSFVVGWVIQFIGHYWEGRKPAFVDDVIGLMVGPLFITAEALFALGLCRPLHADIARHAGPTLLREPRHHRA